MLSSVKVGMYLGGVFAGGSLLMDFCDGGVSEPLDVNLVAK